MDKKREQKILADLERGYDALAEKFSKTRKNSWESLKFIRQLVRENDRVLDFGCGNGRLLQFFKGKQVEYYGVDVSAELIKIAQKNNIHGKAIFQKISSSPTLPFQPNFFNCVFSIAVFHHLPECHARAIAKELARVTKENGLLVATVWNLHQTRFLKYRFSPRRFLSRIFRSGKFKGLGRKDILIPFEDSESGKVFERFHHIFSQKEFSQIFLAAGFQKEKVFLSRNNLIIIARKKKK